MALIKTVTNGSSSAQFRAVSLGHAVTIVFGLLSIIGAQQTWLWAGAHERAQIVSQIKFDIAEDMRAHDLRDESRFREIDRRLDKLELSMDEAQRQININTGKLEQGAAWRGR
jgi:hypothetical protein